MDWAESYYNLYKACSPTGIYKYLNSSNIYYKLFGKQFLNIARLFMNLINDYVANLFHSDIVFIGHTLRCETKLQTKYDITNLNLTGSYLFCLEQ